MIITNTLVSFTRDAKIAVQDEKQQETINTWFRATEASLDSLQDCWLVLVNHELVLASANEAKQLGYSDCDETIKAVDDSIGFSWRHVSKEEGQKVEEELRAAGLLPPAGLRSGK